ncbi:hypothetical protein B4U80_02551 [Leptotrombidium deliense]|uniref:PID domain-containing protein n=1 Tax=Leptotrombidium deliense TaxID=299467 RepID=A0A443SML7_9ACAR|nr:hypothetical protein B4U80_02551 [Leptotrombidium deliense]
MAFRRKDVKKASYYVWFLGAKESKGLRGEQFVVPVLRFLLEKEKELEPSKVTLQVSNKGLKIMQNVPKKSQKSNVCANTKTEQIKHLIPHHAITCAFQEEDIVCCILLIYNPITKCPVHVHTYRCDSLETATALRSQLQQLIDRPENQRKFCEIESRLAIRGLHQKEQSRPPLKPPRSEQSNYDGRSSRTEASDDRTDDSLDSSHSGKDFKNSVEVNSHENAKISILYESLAAELKAKLGNPQTGPILLPPRDYDTISRKQGKLNGIERRKSTNSQIVGNLANTLPVQRKAKAHSESSGKSSSGIGSDEALPTIQEITDYRTKFEDISSEEDRNWSPSGQRTWSPSTKQLYVQSESRNIPAPIAPKSSNISVKTSDTKKCGGIDQPIRKTPLYYFPDPAFSVAAIKQDCNVKLRRQQSSPDYFREVRSPLIEHGFRNSLSPEPFRLRQSMSDVKQRPKSNRSLPISSSNNYRYSFAESCLQTPNIY